MKLLYKVISKDGKQIKGIVEAKDVNEAATYLRRRDLTPISITPQNKQSFLSNLSFNKSTNKDLVFFTRQLSSMISSGLTLMQALTILRDQIQRQSMNDIVSGIINDIQDGQPLSVAISKYPELFSPIYVSLIKASETSGLLDKVLLRLADNLEKQEKLRSTIKGALMYPIIVVIGMIVVVTIMMIFVIPQLTVLYENLNIPLPLPTQIIVGLSKFTINFWPLMIGLVALALFLFRRWHKTEAGKLVIDDLVLKLPVFGKLVKETILAEFARTLGLLVGTGTLVVEALNESADVAGNSLYRNAILGISKRVEKGLTIGDAMNAYVLFPPIIIQMVKIGEQTGKLDESLIRVSEYFEREVDESVKTLTTALEPFIMIMLGLGVAFLIISIIVPIYNLTSSIQ